MKKCYRCGKEAEATWDICALPGKPKNICTDCDIALNELVLWFMNVPSRAHVIARYRRRKRATNER